MMRIQQYNCNPLQQPLRRFLLIIAVLIPSFLTVRAAYNISRNNETIEMNSRYQGLRVDNAPPRGTTERIIFVYITSSPAHIHLRQAARQTWLLPCLASPHCNYRFFIDTVRPNVSGEQSSSLKIEAELYRDIVFRDSCPMLMKRHPLIINYGNSPPVKENNETKVMDPVIGQIETQLLEDYPHRRLYKVEWKVCFLQWAAGEDLVADYHVMVEDDSFVCTENLLHQLTILYNRAHSAGAWKQQSFRTGTPMFDGFDDSSTIMTKDLALLFASHYGEDGFDCSKLLDHIEDAAVLDKFSWLSWGNSWMSRFCDWFGVLATRFDAHPLRPSMDCGRAMMSSEGASNINQSEIRFPCMNHPLILHHPHATDVLLHETKHHIVHHVCEYMFLIDKVKSPHQIYALWHTASLAMDDLHDLSEIFLHNDEKGWIVVLQNLARDETLCRRASSSREIEQDEDNYMNEGMRQCIFIKNRRRRLLQQQLLHKQLYKTNFRLSYYTAGDGEEQELYKYFFGNSNMKVS